MIEDISREKWTAIYAFLFLDIVQILFVSILYLNDSSLFVVGIDFSQTDPLLSISLFIGISIMQIAMLYVSAVQMLRRPDLFEIYPKFNKDMPWKRKYSRENIVTWTLDMAKKSGVTVDKIFLMASPLPNAYTFSLPGLGSIVVVHSNVLDVLNEDEIKAVVTHELGHIKNNDSFVTILTRMPGFFIDIIYLYIYVRLVLAIANSLLELEDLFCWAFS